MHGLTVDFPERTFTIVLYAGTKLHGLRVAFPAHIHMFTIVLSVDFF